MYFILIVLLLVLAYIHCAFSFVSNSIVAFRSRIGSLRNKIGRSCFQDTLRASSKDSEEEREVEVGSKEYFRGFFDSSLNEGTDPRGDGLKQALALAGNATIILVVLTAAFLKSNGVF